MFPLETMDNSSLMSGFLLNEGATFVLTFDCLKDATTSGDESGTVGGARELETVLTRGVKTLVIKRARRSTSVGVINSHN